MKALTIQQPWASLIMSGAKTIENRSRPTTRRDRIAIHAGKNRIHFRGRTPGQVFAEFDQPIPKSLQFGAIIGTVDLVDCVYVEDLGRGHDRRFVEGPWCWVLEDPRLLPEPIHCAGALSFWEAGDLSY